MPNNGSISASSCLDAANQLISSGDVNSGLVLAERALSLSMDAATTERALSLISVHGYYSGDAGMKRLAAQSCERLFTDRMFSGHARGWAMRNTVWYAPMANEKFGNVQFKQIDIERQDGWNLMNPSVCVHEGKICAIQRVVNYHITEEGYYVMHDGNVVKTKNFLIELNENLDVLSSREISYPSTFDTPLYDRSLGMEDCRLFSWRGQLWVSATVLQFNAAGMCEIHLARIDETEDGVSFADVEKITPIGLPVWHEKNWMPFVENDELFWIYSSQPTRVIDRHGQTVRLTTPGIAADTFRGGPQPIRTPKGWLTLIHHSVDGVFKKRVYLHRFVLFDDHFNLIAYSEPFSFRHKGIEFASGLMLLGNDRLVVSFGIEDGESWLAEFSLNAVLGRLGAIPEPKNGISVSEHDWVLAGINTAMKRAADFQQATRLTIDAGLKTHEDAVKNWDSLQAFWSALKTTEKHSLVIDVGATPGSSFLSNLKKSGFSALTGINLDTADLYIHDGVRHQYGDCTAMDFADGSVGFISCQSVIEHGVDVTAFLSESARVLKPNGHLFISTDYWFDGVDARGQMAFGQPIKVFTRSEIEDLVRVAASFGLTLTSKLDLSCGERPVSWMGMEYTFVSLLFKKEHA